MKTVSPKIEQKILVSILEAKNRKVRNYLLSEARVEDFGTIEGKEIRTRMDNLIRYGKSFGNTAIFKEDSSLSKGAVEILDVKSRFRQAAKNLPLKTAKNLVTTLHQYRQAKTLLDGAQRLYTVCTKRRMQHSIQQAETIMLNTIKGLREDRSKKLTHLGVGRTKQDIREDLKRLLKHHDRMFVPTGLSSLDETITGWARGDLVVVTAPRGGGKTAMALQMAINQFKAGMNVGFLSLEMTEDQLKGRAIANVADVDSARVRNRALNKEEQLKVLRAWPAFEMKTSAKYKNRFTPWDVKDPNYRVENIELDLGPFGYDVILIDYITLLKGSGDLWISQKEAGRYLKQLAGRLNCVIVVLTQMNKEDGVKYGSGPEEDADWWLRWRYGEEEKQSGQVSVELAKARHGKAVTVNTFFRLDKMQVECIGIMDRIDAPTTSAATRRYPGDSVIKSPLDASIRNRKPKPRKGKRKEKRKNAR